MELNSELERLQKYQCIERQLVLAKHKHPNWPVDINKQILIMIEEAGEAAQAALKYQDEKGSLLDLKIELMQTAAMCIRILENLPEF